MENGTEWTAHRGTKEIPKNLLTTANACMVFSQLFASWYAKLTGTSTLDVELWDSRAHGQAVRADSQQGEISVETTINNPFGPPTRFLAEVVYQIPESQVFLNMEICNFPVEPVPFLTMRKGILQAMDMHAYRDAREHLELLPLLKNLDSYKKAVKSFTRDPSRLINYTQPPKKLAGLPLWARHVAALNFLKEGTL